MWICKVCETENKDIDNVCMICGEARSAHGAHYDAKTSKTSVAESPARKMPVPPPPRKTSETERRETRTSSYEKGRIDFKTLFDEDEVSEPSRGKASTATVKKAEKAAEKKPEKTESTVYKRSEKKDTSVRTEPKKKGNRYKAVEWSLAAANIIALIVNLYLSQFR